MKKIIRTSTVGTSLNDFCKGFLSELTAEGYDVIGLSSPDAELTELGSRERVRTIGVPMERHIAILKDIKSLWGLYRAFRREKPDMVHSMTPKAGLLCMIAAWMARVPVRIHTFTGLVWPTATGLSRHILKMTDRITCWCATDIIPEGEGVKNDLINGRITRKPLKVLGYGNVRGIDLDYFKRSASSTSSTPSSSSTAEGITFLFVGRLVGDKGINELVHAFVRIYNDNPDIKLFLVGPKESELDPLATETTNLIENCSGISAVGNQLDVRPWMEQADVLVFPSYREGFPNVVLEAGAMDLPCIVTNINGAREIVVEKPAAVDGLKTLRSVESPAVVEGIKICMNGIVVPPRDKDNLEKAMRWMVNHPEERKQMAAAARPWVAAHWEQSFVRQCLKDFYREKLGE